MWPNFPHTSSWLLELHSTLQFILMPLGALLAVRLATLLGGSAIHVLRDLTDALPSAPPKGEGWPKVSVLVPAYNEEAVLEAAVQSTLRCDYPNLDVVIIDDASTDRTLAIAYALAADEPRIRVVAHLQNSGKAAALNTGLRASDAEFVITVDADSVLAPDAPRHLVAPMIGTDVDAVAGNLKVGNRINLLTRFQSIEYVSGLNLLRRAQDTLGFVTTISGAVGAFRRSAVLAVGGVSSDTLVEDSDLSIQLLEARARIVYNPKAKAYTEAPETLRALFRQRSRWLAGFLQLMWKHRGALTHGRPWVWLGYPNLALMFLVMPLTVPVFYALIVLGLLSGNTLTFTALAWMLLLDMLLVGCCYAVDREDLRELLILPLWWITWPALVFLQFMMAIRKLLGDSPHAWQKLRRSGRALLGS